METSPRGWGADWFSVVPVFEAKLFFQERSSLCQNEGTRLKHTFPFSCALFAVLQVKISDAGLIFAANMEDASFDPTATTVKSRIAPW